MKTQSNFSNDLLIMNAFIFSLIFFILNFALSHELTNNNQLLIIENSNLGYDLTSNINDRFETARTKMYFQLKSEIQKQHYPNPCHSKTTNNRKDTDSVEGYDTQSESDVVRIQYSKLPYPPVTDQSLAKEKMYYDDNINPIRAYGAMRNKPYFVSYGTTLEAVNHFLFKGKSNFT